SFDNIQLDLGSFLSDFLGPIVGVINDVLTPIKPILDVLDERLPVLSDLEPTRALLDKNNDGDVTLIEMAALLGSGFETAATFIDAVTALADIADFISSNVSVGDSVLIDFGSFDLGGFDPRGAADLSAVNPRITQAAQDFATQVSSRGQQAQKDVVA